MTASSFPAAISKYRVERLLGAGGMGTVYLAVDDVLHRPVALKVIQAEGGDAGVRERFLREARAVARLDHPSIVRVFEADERDGVLFLAMELVEGEDGAAFAGRRPPLAERLRVLLDVAEALTYAHSKGVIHRDVKPANVLVTRHGRAKLIDFGLAREFGRAEVVTGAGLGLVGSGAYLSPEQILAPATVDVRTDVFSFGVMLYELLTDRQPFAAATLEATIVNIVHTTPAAAATVEPGLPRRLTQAVDLCLAKDPAARPTVAEISAALQEALGTPVNAPPPPPSVPFARPTLPDPEERFEPSIDESGSATLPVGAPGEGGGETRAGRNLLLAALAVAVLGAALVFALEARRRSAPATPGLAPPPTFEARPDTAFLSSWEPGTADVTAKVGEQVTFRVTIVGVAEREIRWNRNDEPVGSGPTFPYTATSAGTRDLVVATVPGRAELTRVWIVNVEE